MHRLTVHPDHHTGRIQIRHRGVRRQQMHLHTLHAPAERRTVHPDSQIGGAQHLAFPADTQLSERHLIGVGRGGRAGLLHPGVGHLRQRLQPVDHQRGLIGELITAAGHPQEHISPVRVDDFDSGVTVFDHDRTGKLRRRRGSGAPRLADHVDLRRLRPVHPGQRRGQRQHRLLFGVVGVDRRVKGHPLQHRGKERRDRGGGGLGPGEHRAQIAEHHLLPEPAAQLGGAHGFPHGERQSERIIADLRRGDVDVERHHRLPGGHLRQVHRRQQGTPTVGDLDEPGGEIHRGVDQSAQPLRTEPGLHRNREVLIGVGADQRDLAGQPECPPRQRDLGARPGFGVQRVGVRGARAGHRHHQQHRHQRAGHSPNGVAALV